MNELDICLQNRVLEKSILEYVSDIRLPKSMYAKDISIENIFVEVASLMNFK